MKIQQIRNATLKINIGGRIILTDPVLLPRHGIESFAGNERNPTVELPVPVEEVLANVDMVLVSHLHQDHFDTGAKEILPKDLPLFCQPGDRAAIEAEGFTRVSEVADVVAWEDIEIRRTPGAHAGSPKWQDILGQVSGYLLTAPDCPRVYWAGDTILGDWVRDTIAQWEPEIILTHSCGAVLEDSGPIVMDARMTVDVCKLAPKAVVVATHMEALDHATVTRQALRDHARASGIPDDRLLIPADGETLSF